MIIPVLPSRSLVRIYATIWVLLYWLVYFFLRDLFPHKVLTDAMLIQQIGMGIREGGGGAYSFMAYLYSRLPEPLSHVLVGIFNGWVLFLIVSTVRTFRGMVIMVPILVPFIVLNMQAPTKETMVVAIALFITAISWRMKTDLKLIALITSIYIPYGIFLREYYILILLAFLALILILKTAPSLRWLYVLPAIAVFLLIPNNVFTALQGPRDQVNLWLGTGETADVRTFFYNPFPPDSLVNFIGNYVYALVILNFPFLMFFTVKEILMFLNVLFYGWLTINGMRFLRGTQRLLPFLFLAHVSVLILFEPDLGSYFRHFSSVLLYLIPSWALIEERHVSELEKKLFAMRAV